MMDCIMQYHDEQCYRELPSAVAQEVLRQLGRDWKAFFRAAKEYKRNPGKFTGHPSLPKKKETGSMSAYTYSQRGCSLHEDKETGNQYVTFACSDDILDIGDVLIRKENYDDLKFQTVDCTPIQGGFELHLTYSFDACALVGFNDRVGGCDLGVDNLMTLVSNAGDTRPLIVDGKLLKSKNRYYNMRDAKIKSRYQGCTTSKQKRSLWQRRSRELDNLIGEAANIVGRWLVENDICLFVVGKSDEWKSGETLERWRKDVKQSFVFLPHAKVISRLRDKCEELGIRFAATEESYTSKASLMDGDYLPVYGVDERPDGGFDFSGSRVSRGLFRSKKTFLEKDLRSRGAVLNADVNGAGNIIRKVVPSAFSNVSDWRFLMCPDRARLGRVTVSSVCNRDAFGLPASGAL